VCGSESPGATATRWDEEVITSAATRVRDTLRTSWERTSHAASAIYQAVQNGHGLRGSGTQGGVKGEEAGCSQPGGSVVAVTGQLRGGLSNVHNNCWCNATTQLLLHSSAVLGEIEGHRKCHDASGCPLCILRRLATETESGKGIGDGGAWAPFVAKYVPGAAWGRHNDASELLHAILLHCPRSPAVAGRLAWKEERQWQMYCPRCQCQGDAGKRTNSSAVCMVAAAAHVCGGGIDASPGPMVYEEDMDASALTAPCSA